MKEKLKSVESDLRSNLSQIDSNYFSIKFDFKIVRKIPKLTMNIYFKSVITRSYVKRIQELMYEYSSNNDKYDFNIILSSVVFSSYRISMEFDLIESNSEVFNATFEKFGLNKSIVGKEFTSCLPKDEGKNIKCTVIGIKPRCYKYPFLVRKDGKVLRYGEQTLKTMLGGVNFINRMTNLDSLLNLD